MFLPAVYVWLLPAALLAPPSYRRARFDTAAGANRITCLVGDQAGALPIGQAVRASRLLSDTGRGYAYGPAEGHGLYAFVIDGEAEIAGIRLAHRDGIALEGEQQVDVMACAGGIDMLLIEMPLSCAVIREPTISGGL